MSPLFILSLAWQLLKTHLGRPVPIFCEYEITYRCNLNCSFCSQQRFAHEWEPELSCEQAKAIISQLYSAGTRLMNMSGGEPSLRPDFIEIAQHARNLGIFISLNTNGYLIDEAMAQKMTAFHMVRVSIDGNGQLHDRLRRHPGSFARAVSAIKLLKKNGVRVMINSVITNSHSHQDLREIAELARSLDVQVSFSAAEASASAARTQTRDFIDGLLADGRMHPATAALLIRSLHSEFSESVVNDSIYIETLEKSDANPGRCRVLDTSIALKPDGSFAFPCNDFPIFPMRSSDCEALFNSVEVKRIRADLGTYWFCERCTSRCSVYPNKLAQPFGIISLARSWAKVLFS
ncbi:MAG: hypothetical protein A2X94_08435 [Bdellovibrionales bacterium GWB1_55_8]|nr:MAG: hypothetical protein A2X94_08435 [Bdellovibrionales bacterium GWB1_55_8]